MTNWGFYSCADCGNVYVTTQALELHACEGSVQQREDDRILEELDF